MVCRINDHFQERRLQITVPEKKKRKKKKSISHLLPAYTKNIHGTLL